MQIFQTARLGWGIWKAFKRIYKLAEDRHDAAMFGVLAYRLDAFYTLPHTGEIMPGTIVYMRRRPWRYLRQLGRAVPELYPQFAAQVLEHYPKHFYFNGAWTAAQIWSHQDLVGEPGPACYARGVNCYVVKPLDLDYFTRLVQAINSFWFEVAVLPPR